MRNNCALDGRSSTRLSVAWISHLRCSLCAMCTISQQVVGAFGICSDTRRCPVQHGPSTQPVQQLHRPHAGASKGMLGILRGCAVLSCAGANCGCLYCHCSRSWYCWLPDPQSSAMHTSLSHAPTPPPRRLRMLLHCCTHTPTCTACIAGVSRGTDRCVQCTWCPRNPRPLSGPQPTAWQLPLMFSSSCTSQ
jgi:hypothetical protein